VNAKRDKILGALVGSASALLFLVWLAQPVVAAGIGKIDSRVKKAFGGYKVSVVSPEDEQVLMFDGSTGLWVAESLGAAVGSVLSDGTVELTADWDVGPYKLTALQFESDIATGSGPPLVVASAAKVTNLNADQLDGESASAFQDQNGALQSIADMTTAVYGSIPYATANGDTMVTLASQGTSGQPLVSAGGNALPAFGGILSITSITATARVDTPELRAIDDGDLDLSAPGAAAAINFGVAGQEVGSWAASGNLNVRVDLVAGDDVYASDDLESGDDVICGGKATIDEQVTIVEAGGGVDNTADGWSIAEIGTATELVIPTAYTFTTAAQPDITLLNGAITAATAAVVSAAATVQVSTPIVTTEDEADLLLKVQGGAAEIQFEVAGTERASITAAGVLLVTGSVATPAVDALVAGTLTLGSGVATSLTLGRTGITVEVDGPLRPDEGITIPDDQTVAYGTGADRFVVGELSALTDGVADEFLAIQSALGDAGGVVIVYTIKVTTATGVQQAETGTVELQTLDGAGGVISSLGESSQQVLEAGTLSTTFALDTTDDGDLELSVNADTSLTPTAMTISFTANCSGDVTVLVTQ